MKNVIKWILISVVTIIIIVVIIAGIYKFNYLANQPGYDIDGNKIESINNSEVFLNLFNLKTSNRFFIKIPKTNKECEISEIINLDSLRYAKGYYIDGEEKGEVLINSREILALNKSSDNIVYLVIPFSISNQGSGTFKYLGLFELNNKTKTINQTDSYFLGDRVKINSINYDGFENLQVELKIHFKNQAMAEAPSELKLLELKVNDGHSFGIELIK